MEAMAYSFLLHAKAKLRVFFHRPPYKEKAMASHSSSLAWKIPCLSVDTLGVLIRDRDINAALGLQT